MAADHPLCSVVLVSYNNFASCTGPCIKSLLEGQDNIECIVVDNSSDDHSRNKLKELSDTDPRLKIVFNCINRGYAGGNNDGVAVATGDIIVLLNNDTIVPAGAMTQLVSLLHKNPSWDMLGPVTNSCGNEQQIHTSGNSPGEILKEGWLWCQDASGLSFETDILGFFCVAMRKELYLELSGLDEAFGVGFYEDTDFCYRARFLGKSLWITEDIFIYHQGSATFTKQPAETKRLMAINRELFRKKHKGCPKSPHVRTKNISILRRYKDTLTQNGDARPACHRALNRLAIARTLRPNNPIKRLLYWKSLKPLHAFFMQCCKQST